MRITILVVGSQGDVQPLVAFGIGLQKAGHEVRIATQPMYREFITSRGLEFAGPVELQLLDRLFGRCTCESPF